MVLFYLSPRGGIRSGRVRSTHRRALVAPSFARRGADRWAIRSTRGDPLPGSRFRVRPLDRCVPRAVGLLSSSRRTPILRFHFAYAPHRRAIVSVAAPLRRRPRVSADRKIVVRVRRGPRCPERSAHWSVHSLPQHASPRGSGVCRDPALRRTGRGVDHSMARVSGRPSERPHAAPRGARRPDVSLSSRIRALASVVYATHSTTA
jgi:hypothetical protein